MIFKVLTLIALFWSISGCDAQTIKLTKPAALAQPDAEFKSIYNVKDEVFINKLRTIKYDSVKVFYFNENKINVDDFSLKADTPHIYSTLKATPIADTRDTLVSGFAVVDRGRKVSHKDARLLLDIFEYSYKDIFKDDPVSPYMPTCGFVFFNNGVATAHIDVALFCEKVQIEVLGTQIKPYQYKFTILGFNMYHRLIKLIKKYELPSWVLTGE